VKSLFSSTRVVLGYSNRAGECRSDVEGSVASLRKGKARITVAVSPRVLGRLQHFEGC
jgi:hypothetical protein